MLKSGLVSVSFRFLGCDDIIALASENGLGGIEWGADVHILPGDVKKAEEVRIKTENAGLTVTSYGSYYRVGTYGGNYKSEFKKVLESAAALNAPVIRVWAGVLGSGETDKETRENIINETSAICDMAKGKNISVAFECHNNTLTDDRISFVNLLKEVNRDNLKMFWQPNQKKDFEYNLKALDDILPYLTNIHVFNWKSDNSRLFLEDGVSQWKEYFGKLKGKDNWCLLEFMPEDNPDYLKKEAKSLNGLLNYVNNGI